MDSATKSAESQSASMSSVAESAHEQVFQPPKLKEIVDVIDLMGTVASRVREDKSGDLPGGAMAGAGTGAATGTSARDDAIANVPAAAIMQKQIIKHVRQEIASVEREARKIARRADKRGSAYMLTELYRKIRRLTSIITAMLDASADVIKRFYVSIFIDNQPLVVTEGSAKEAEK